MSNECLNLSYAMYADNQTSILHFVHFELFVIHVRCDHDDDPDRQRCWVLHLLYALLLSFRMKETLSPGSPLT